jgi:hypothetical protein
MKTTTMPPPLLLPVAPPPEAFRSRLRVLLCLLIACLLSFHEISNNFALVRTASVGSYYHVAVMFNLGDMSRGGLFTQHRHPSIAEALPIGKGGCVWEVGAHDGVWESNSYHIIRERGFHAWLYEPSPEAFIKLRNLYGQVHRSRGSGDSSSDSMRTHPNVHLFNMALSNATGVALFRSFPVGLENTLQAYDRDNQFDEVAHEYTVGTYNAQLLCEQQKLALSRGDCRVGEGTTGDGDDSDGDDFTVLSIDTEGSDTSVLQAAHITGCTWDLLIIESLYLTPPDMRSYGYKYIKQVSYNHIFMHESVCLNRG